MANAPVPSDTIVYRAIRKSRWVIEGELQYIAFVLRSDKGETELSILTEGNCRDGEYCAAIRFDKCYGEIILTAQTFTNLGLEVMQTPEPDIPYHASVFGLPPYFENEFEEESEARNIAEEILETVLDIKSRKFKR